MAGAGPSSWLPAQYDTPQRIAPRTASATFCQTPEVPQLLLNFYSHLCTRHNLLGKRHGIALDMERTLKSCCVHRTTVAATRSGKNIKLPMNT
ncbi:hypothetical protein AV530_018987 [Patagioenas fasciata monilis]|uniref:Uncharacterized protein n=1 Tax=Patagioenas fasciata monilis TaxID=372326 RepID=A0A1V4KXU9_PATFA|nr:hypothetical protein AV530_018987 [Patagioenas fasciata monilis]